MAPGLNLLRPRRGDGHGGFGGDSQQIAALMAERPSQRSHKEEEEADKVKIFNEGDAASCARSKVDGDGSGRDVGWLQLGVGGARGSRSTGSNLHDPSTSREKGDLVELELFDRRPPDLRSTAEASPLVVPALAPPWLPAVMGGYSCHQHWEINPRPSSAAATVPPPMPSSCSWGRLPPPSSSSSSARPDGEMRVVNLPRWTQTGVWFVLQAAQDQIKEPFLPQIPKSYLRIKDGRMTIRLLMKYLANKLVLEDESQVEIRCRGQQLPPFVTLIYVRDNIWCSPQLFDYSNSSSSSSRFVMNLFYSRS
ncbi:hypothetical protein Cni_G26763 [Canna indica]|uniref:Uncharacterized protein n=1 Tax=Canna indica TaxID=4628 RepID=A0AAQ3QRL6_9LILI|nr:hypothetical protein Cni_G26763 [Canna indica]